jgi:phage/plasmid-like protein (TIGR03299 family)
MEWLNSMTLIGFTEKRGTAWHYRSDLQGETPNHYPGAIPVPDVLERLFNFEVEERPIYILTDAGYVEIAGRKAMATTDSEEVLGIFKQGYQGHSYKEWLLESVATILDDELSIGSAGLLKNRAQAWVSVEVPENIVTPEGVEFRPNLVACTSFDGSLATTYKRLVTNVVCDNTLAQGLNEDGQTFKLRHSKYSGMRLQDARDALAIVHSIADDFAAEVAKLCKEKVSDKRFTAVLDALYPVPADEGRGQTVITKKRDEIAALWANDERVAPWKGTAFGVLQAHNTWNQHYAQVRKGVPRVIRNMENAVKDKSAMQDSQVLAVLAAV